MKNNARIILLIGSIVIIATGVVRIVNYFIKETASDYLELSLVYILIGLILMMKK